MVPGAADGGLGGSICGTWSPVQCNYGLVSSSRIFSDYLEDNERKKLYDLLLVLQNLDSASIGRPRPHASMTDAARVWFMGAGRSRAMSALAMWHRQRSADGLLLWLAKKGSKPSQQVLGGAGTLALVRNPAQGIIRLHRDDRHSLGSVVGGGGGVTLKQGISGIFGNHGGQGSIRGNGRSGMLNPAGCRTSPWGDGAAAAAASADPSTPVAADGWRLGTATAKATSKEIRMRLSDGAIDHREGCAREWRFIFRLEKETT